MRRTLFLILFLHLYFISGANNWFHVNQESNFNWINIWLSFFFGLLFTILFRFLNTNSKTIDQRSDAGQPISGWVFFLGINLVGRIIVQTYFFWDANYFQYSAAVQLKQSGGVNLQSLFIFEMFLTLFGIAGTGALIYWFLGRRDIFPSMFIYYVSFYLVATFILFIIYHYMSLPADMIGIRRNRIFLISRVICAVIWVVFILKSRQVKETFVYPAN